MHFLLCSNLFSRSVYQSHTFLKDGAFNGKTYFPFDCSFKNVSFEEKLLPPSFDTNIQVYILNPMCMSLSNITFRRRLKRPLSLRHLI